MTDLELIKQKIDIVSLISESVVLKKTGANFKGLCPFHVEKTPSFIVSPERQIWHCFGGCQDGGDIFKFVMKMENIEFSEALQILAKRAGVKLSSYAPSKTTELRDHIFAVNHLASEFYNYILTSHPLGQKARDYLTNRLITNDSVKLFSLGYAPNSWDSLINFLTKKGYTAADLEAAGLVSKSGIGHLFDRFRGRIIFTLKDHRGNVVGFAGRLLDPNAKEAKYINTAETAVYVKGDVLYGLDVTREEIKKEGFAVVVEGEIDAIASYQAGIKNVVAIKGSALTSGQVALLKRYTENISLSLDADYAGDAAAHRGIVTADASGLNIKVVTFAAAKDPDELIKTAGPALWREAVKKAANFYDFIIDSACKKFDPKSAEGGKKIVAEVAKFLSPIDNLIVKNHYLKKLTTILAISQEDLEMQIDKEYRQTQIGRATPESSPIPQSPKSRSSLVEEYLITLLLQST
ncbi:DNA primase, partial [Candidatus Microgenomates bacterium]|nr:DNA primase [Candidatus Microgenomates bacterium]